MFQDIQVDFQGGIATIKLNRPEVLNAVRIRTYEDLIDALYRIENNTEIHVVILTGNGRAFCSGNDLKDFLPSIKSAQRKKNVGELFRALAKLSKPLILAIEGVAIGIGTNFLLHADLAYAGKSTEFSLPFTKLGVTPEGACSLLLAETVGQKTASELLLTGRRFNTKEALDWRLINERTPDGKALTKAREMAELLLNNSKESLRQTKLVSKSHLRMSLVNQVIDGEIEVFEKMLNTADTQKRVRSVLKKP